VTACAIQPQGRHRQALALRAASAGPIRIWPTTTASWCCQRGCANRATAKVEFEGPRPSEEAVYGTFEDAHRTIVLGEADTIDIFDPITGEAHAVKLFVAAMDIWTIVRLGLTCAK
jgi:hypothetical protein